MAREKNVFIAAFAVLAVFVAMGCTQPGQPAGGSSGTSGADGADGLEAGFYENQYYSLSHPPDWKIQEGENVVLFQSPLENDADSFYENVSVFVDGSGAVEEAGGLSSFVEETLDPLLESGAGLQIIDFTQDSYLDNAPAVAVTYSVDDVDYGKLQYFQLFALKGDKYYVVTYTAKPDTFLGHLKKVTSLIASVKLKGAGSPGGQDGVQGPDSEVVGNWRIYSETLFYDGGGSSLMSTPTSRLLELRADHSWSFGSSNGSWKISAIAESDWEEWGVGDYGPTQKITLHGWSGGIASGPVEESETRVDFLWAIYRVGPPTVESPGQVQMKFGRTSS
ncbi:MAG TPA: hypothetical protein VJA40_04910 [archaeon]|nr:hypothetical protein [archaeon]